MIPLFSAGRLALGSITSAKLRSTLTVLGIVIGVAAVIANVSLGASFNQHFTNEVTNLGSNFIYIQGMQPKLFYDNQLTIVKIRSRCRISPDPKDNNIFGTTNLYP